MRPIGKHDDSAVWNVMSWWYRFQVEILVLIGVFFLYVQLVLGRLRPRTSNWFVQSGAWAAYNLSFMLPTYTLAVIQSSEKVDAYPYPVWILSLVTLVGGTNSIVVYDHQKDQASMWIFLQVVFFGCRSILTFVRAGLIHQGSLMYWVTNGVFITFMLACALGKTATMARSSLDHIKVVADYMKTEHKTSADEGDEAQVEFDATTMRGYRYLVDFRCPSGASTTQLQRPDMVTVEDIYKQQSETGFPDLDQGDGVQLSKKGQCLSFALFRLLMRRYHGLTCAEAKLEKTRALVLQGLLPRPRRQDGFRVIEAELGFMHDYFFTGYAFLSRRHRLHYMFIFVSKMVIMYIGGPVLCSGVGISSMESVNSYRSHAQRNIAYLILVLHFGLDLLQLILYCTSDWWTVSYICCRHRHFQTQLIHEQSQNRHQSWRTRCLAHLNKSKLNYEGHIVARLSRVGLFLFGQGSYWQNKVGQYSLLQDFERCSWRSSAAALIEGVTAPHQRSRWFTHHTEGHSVVLPSSVVGSVAKVLRKSRSTHERVLALSWLVVPGTTLPLDWLNLRKGGNRNVLMWHIATCLCEMDMEVEHGEGTGPATACSGAYVASTTLSRYCAYLMAFHPELLPDHEMDTRAIFCEVLQEVKLLLAGVATTPERFQVLKRSDVRKQMGPILKNGITLGELLLENIPEPTQRWMALKNIWALIVISVAPSSDAKHHVERLARGGEFITHLWALLSHAGVMDQQSWTLF